MNEQAPGAATMRKLDLRESLDAAEIVLGRRPLLLRGSIWLLFLLIVAAVLYASLTRVDEVVVARGRVVVRGDQYRVEAPATGTVVEVKAHEGEAVRKGDALVVLDSRDLELRRQEARLRRKHWKEEKDLLDDLVKTLDDKNVAQRLSLEREIEIARTQEELARADLERRKTELDFRGKREEKTRKFYADKLERIKGTKDSVSDIEKELSRTEKELAGIRLEEAQEGGKQLESARPLEEHYARLQVARAKSSAGLRRLEAAAARTEARIRLEGVRLELERLPGEIERLTREIEDRTIRAPEGGIITRMPVVRRGEVLQVGDPVASISPGGSYVLQARVRNEDMGKLRTGLPARIRFHAFPYQDYGAFDGTVAEISPDTVDEAASEYEILVTFKPGDFEARTGKTLKLGYTAMLDIVTGRVLVIRKLLGRTSAPSRSRG